MPNPVAVVKAAKATKLLGQTQRLGKAMGMNPYNSYDTFRRAGKMVGARAGATPDDFKSMRKLVREKGYDPRNTHAAFVKAGKQVGTLKAAAKKKTTY